MRWLGLISFVIILNWQIFAFEVPRLAGPVVDEASMLSSQTKREIGSMAYQLNQNHAIQLQVLTVNDLQGENIENVSIQVTDKWKLGNSQTDKGILLLIAKNDRQIRIEVGQGLEGDIPDATAKRIIEEVIKPYFRDNDFDLGVKYGVMAIIKSIVPEFFNGSSERVITRKSRGGSPKWLQIAVIIFLIFFSRTSFGSFLLGMFLGSGLSRGRGGFGGGGGWSGGGGGFSGGGASGRW